MSILQTALLLTATITTGLMAGLFSGFAYAVMPGLARSSDSTMIETMQNINKAIINGWFMLPFLGSIVLIAWATILSWVGDGRPVLPWIIAALVLYLVAFFITAGVNVPLNDQLATAGRPGGNTSLMAARGTFERRWVRANILRAVVHTAAFGCLAASLIAS